MPVSCFAFLICFLHYSNSVHSLLFFLNFIRCPFSLSLYLSSFLSVVISTRAVLLYGKCVCRAHLHSFCWVGRRRKRMEIREYVWPLSKTSTYIHAYTPTPTHTYIDTYSLACVWCALKPAEGQKEEETLNVAYLCFHTHVKWIYMWLDYISLFLQPCW